MKENKNSQQERNEMKNLMEACRNWGAEGCHPDISKWKSVAEIEKGEEIIIRPDKEKLDKICKNCRALFFNECPDCNSADIFVKSEFEIKKKGKKIENISFYCDNCKHSFIITRQI